MKNSYKLLIALIAPQLAGLLGSLSTQTGSGSWYASLIRPELAPPNWVFGPVWTTLYLLMGVALYLVWTSDHAGRQKALTLFWLQLALNTLWSFLYFGAESLSGALVEIVFLWIAIAATIAAFWKISKTAAYLMVPYIAWVTFAAYLNYMFWVLN